VSVLDRLRSGSDSTFVQLLLGGVLVSFVVYYGQNRTGNKGRVVATVNGHAIQDVELNRAYDRAERNMGGGLSQEEKDQLQATVTQQLIREEVLRQQAHAMDLEVSDTEIARDIFNTPFFQDEGGKFDDKIYANVLRRMGMSQAEFEARNHDDLLRAQVRDLAWLGGTVTDAGVRAAWTEQQTTVDIEYVRVTETAFRDDVDLAPEKVTTFETENKERIEQAYQADFDRLYNHPEQVSMHMIRLPVRQDGVLAADLAVRLEAARARIEGGAPFETVARELSEDPSAAGGGDLGEVPVTALDSAVATALTDVQPGGMAVVTEETEVKLVRVDARSPAHVVALDEVRDTIAKQLMADDDAPRAAAKYAEDLLAAWKDAGAPPQDKILAQGLTLDDTGPVPARPTRQAGLFSPPDDLIKEAAHAAPGALSKVYEYQGVWWVAALKERTDPDMSKFDEQKADIREQVLLGRRAMFALAWTRGVVAEAKTN
jgi:peptidyl-prolyl cis-trans isomerase D